MRRSIMYSNLVALSVGTACSVTMPEPEHVLVSRVEHRPVAAQLPPEAALLFVGDMMFDRSVRTYAEKHGWEHIFSCAEESLSSYDAVVGNLEGPVTKHASVSAHKKVGEVGNTQFTFPPEVLPELRRLGFAAVSIGNNHIRDFGPQGIDETRAHLEAAGIAYAGDPRDGTNRSTTLTINGMQITLVIFNEFFGKSEDTVTELEKHADKITVVFAHWGDEYLPATDRQKKWAKQFVEAGADAVIGAHPHVVQELEIINGVPVYYSLGNFIFDQYWTDSVREGKAVALTFTQGGLVNMHESRVTLEKDRSSCVIPGEGS